MQADVGSPREETGSTRCPQGGYTNPPSAGTDLEGKHVPAGLGGRALETAPRTTHSPTRTAESTGPPGLRAGRAQVAGKLTRGGYAQNGRRFLE